MKPKIVRWIAGIVVGLLVLIAVAIILVQNHGFQHYVITKVLRDVSESTNTRIAIKNFSLHPAKLSIDIYGMTIHGTEPTTAPALLAADHVALGVRVISFLHRQWNLDHLIIDHPAVNLMVDKNGNSNIPPQKKSTPDGSSTNIFDLAVQTAAINHGEVSYNSLKSSLDAELHGLQLNSHFTSAGHYVGSLGYENGVVHYSDYNPLVSSFKADFDVAREGMKVNNVLLASGTSQFTANAALNDYSAPKINGTYDARIAAGEFAKLLKNPSVPSGTIRLAGSVYYDTHDKRPLLASVRMQGEISSSALAVNTTSFRGDVRDVRAQFNLANGNFEARNLHAVALGGTLNGNAKVDDLTGRPRGLLRASLNGVSLSDVKSISTSASVRSADVSGRINTDINATWESSMENLVARANATISASLGAASAKANGVNPVPLNGAIHATYLGRSGEITLAKSYIHAPNTSITMDGTVSEHSALQVNVHSSDLSEIDTLATVFHNPQQQSSGPLGLGGTATFDATVTGTPSNLRVAGLLTANNLQVKGSSWRLLRTNVSLSPSEASLHNGTLQSAKTGRVNFDVSAGLRNWSYTPANPIQVKLTATQMQIADLERIVGKEYPVSGVLAADVNVHGSQANPVGNGTVNLTQAKVSGETVQSASVRFQGDGNSVNATLQVKMPAGNAQGQLKYLPKTQGYDVQLQAHGIQLNKLEAVQAKNMDLVGAVDIDASGNGTLKDPQLQASVRVPQLQARGQSFRGVTLNTDVKNHVATVALDSEAFNTTITGRGTIRLTDDYYTDAKLDTKSIPLQPIVAVYMPAQAANMNGQTELHAWVRGPLKDKNRLEAHLEIPALTLTYKTVNLAAAAPIRADFHGGVLTVAQTTIRGTGTDLQLQGVIPVTSNRPAQITAQGTLDLHVAEIVDPNISSSGQVRFNINGTGAGGNRSLQGQIRVINAGFYPADSPVGLDNVNGVLTLRNDSLELTELKGEIGGGKLTASGAVRLRPTMQFDVAINARNVRMQYPDGVRTAANADLALAGGLESSMLRGRVAITQLSFTQDFDLANFMSQFSGESAPAPSSQLTENMHLSIAVQSTSAANLVSSKLSVQGAANLQVSGTAANPVILGRTTLSGGELFFMGNRYVVQNGTINFVNPVRTEPIVNLRVTTTVDQYNITMNFQGPADRLHTTYTSDPALPPADIINLLAFGKTTEASAANPAPGTLGAQSVVASQVTSQISGRIEKIAGISHLSIDPGVGGNQTGQNNGPRIAVQQRVTGNLFVTFATDVTSTQNQTVQVEYRMSPRTSINAVRDQNGGFGFDVRKHKTF